MNQDTVLEVENLAVRFGRTAVLQGLSFQVRRASVLAIIGPNGAGKTVLFKALIGSLPHDGHVRWKPPAKIGYVPQKLDIERDLPLTGSDFMRAKAALAGAPPGEVSSALAAVGLSATTCEEPIARLSGGQFQRLLVAAALIGRPDVLLFDEPTSGVDEPGQQTVYQSIDRVRDEHGMTILLISHDLSVVYGRADNVLCLSRPKACFGPPQEVLTPALLGDLYGAPVRHHVHHGG
jgi:zinc transport system ATP-binding protein